MRCSNKKMQVQVYHNKMLNSKKENETRESNTSLYFPVRSPFPPGSCSAHALSCVAPPVRISLSHLCPFVQEEHLIPHPPLQPDIQSRSPVLSVFLLLYFDDTEVFTGSGSDDHASISIPISHTLPLHLQLNAFSPFPFQRVRVVSV